MPWARSLAKKPLSELRCLRRDLLPLGGRILSRTQMLGQLLREALVDERLEREVIRLVGPETALSGVRDAFPAAAMVHGPR